LTHLADSASEIERASLTGAPNAQKVAVRGLKTRARYPLLTSVVPMRMALVFYWAPNSAGAEAKSAEPITASKPRPIILTEIPPQSTHMAAMRALPAEFDGCLTRHGQIRPGGGRDSAAPPGRQFVNS